jgi:hypothetical protein
LPLAATLDVHERAMTLLSFGSSIWRPIPAGKKAMTWLITPDYYRDGQHEDANDEADQK